MTATIVLPQTESASPTQGSKRLFAPGFASLMSVSFLGAANDNILKQILMLMVVAGGLWANRLGAGTQGIISLVLSVPFIVLSGYAGQVADRFSKQRVIKWVKIAEIPIALFALLGLALGSFWFSMFALLLLAIQSAFYGPAKFGIIPELVSSHRLSQANGLLNAVTNLAVILGSLAAGPLADLYYPTMARPVAAKTAAESSIGGEFISPSKVGTSNVDASKSLAAASELVPDPTRQPQRLPIGLALVLVSGLGFCAIRMMPRMRAVDPNVRLSFDLLRPHIQTFKEANRPLLVVLYSWAGFYFIAALALLLIPDYKVVLGASNTAITNLTGVLAIAIVIGSCTVGFLSGKTIRPYFTVFGALGMTICFAIMGITTPSYLNLATLIFLIGFFAGCYIVPLQALLQFLSPADERGRFFGTANALSFTFISAAGVSFYLLRRAGVPTERMPLVCAGLALVGTIVGMLQLKRFRTPRS